MYNTLACCTISISFPTKCHSMQKFITPHSKDVTFFMKIALEVKYPCKNSAALNLGFRILFSHLKIKGEVTPMKTD
jgi:hypothetical protein